LRELSLHLIDIAENGIAAGADLITIKLYERKKENLLEISIADNGKGIPQNLLKKVVDPFFTTKTTRRIGLGLSLFKEAAARCEGEFGINSEEGKGTEVFASFKLGHIDLAPMGDMAGSITCLIMGNPDVDFLYVYEINGEAFTLDTREIRKELDGVPINAPEVIRFIGDMIKDSLKCNGGIKWPN
jgi:anti-sigma regulatory factor (Ser/Thr protein kinase)